MSLESAEVGARTREIAITGAASNIFLPAAGPPEIPYILNGRGVRQFTVQNNSANIWYYGYAATVTVPGGANPGMKIAAGGSVVIKVSSAVIQSTGFWIISAGAGPDEGVVEELI